VWSAERRRPCLLAILYLLDQEARSWGVEQHGGNTLWFEVAVTED